MKSRFLAALIVLLIIVLFTYAVLLNPNASASPKELTVISQTSGREVLKAEVLDDQVTISLKNNHGSTITAFAIKFSDVTIREDFAYSDVHSGIEPGDTFQKSYPLPPSPVSSELPPLYLRTVLLKNATEDGNPIVAQEIKDERLGEKIQILRMLRIVEKEGHPLKDLKRVKGDIVAALNTGDFETRIILNELQPTRIDSKLSDDLKTGLQFGREKVLRRFEAVEQLPTEQREQAFIELKDRSHKLVAKL